MAIACTLQTISMGYCVIQFRLCQHLAEQGASWNLASFILFNPFECIELYQHTIDNQRSRRQLSMYVPL